ncbi:GNAT family N-acetyltransferase [Yoonia litorea]|uniref:Ribosomal protein S18 acetylase RimI n=1 Tax=Yoonia litorea TaxID=1123755 RepID=A0A1I6MFY4_9RHOB|nr:N-acetyltransferase [Yoonia litorea]SFS14542.1 Ribosomal protein S18 acetylase RimI [Yoonia litorea]
MLIRPAGAYDSDVIWPLLRDVFRRGDTYAVDPAISRQDALAYWVDRPDATFVAEHQERVLGTYYLCPNQSGGGAHVCNCGYIVDPSARGQGVARAMCEHSQEIAREIGYRAMQFNFVLESNEGAIRLWTRLGFQIIGTIPEAFDHPSLGYVAAHIMHKSLI